MSDLQREVVNMVALLGNDTLLSVKPLLEKLLDNRILQLDPNANIKEMDEYDKIALLRANQILEDGADTISYEEVLEELGLN